MVIEIPGCEFRINGGGTEWAVEYPAKDRGAATWRGRYFFPSLEFAIGKAYELALIAKESTVDISQACEECTRIKKQLIASVRKEVGK